MVLRYHWGFGVGHTYSHTGRLEPYYAPHAAGFLESDEEDQLPLAANMPSQLGGDSVNEAGIDLEFGLEERENDDLGAESSEELHDETAIDLYKLGLHYT